MWEPAQPGTDMSLLSNYLEKGFLVLRFEVTPILTQVRLTIPRGVPRCVGLPVPAGMLCVPAAGVRGSVHVPFQTCVTRSFVQQAP